MKGQEVADGVKRNERRRRFTVIRGGCSDALLFALLSKEEEKRHSSVNRPSHDRERTEDKALRDSGVRGPVCLGDWVGVGPVSTWKWYKSTVVQEASAISSVLRHKRITVPLTRKPQPHGTRWNFTPLTKNNIDNCTELQKTPSGRSTNEPLLSSTCCVFIGTNEVQQHLYTHHIDFYYDISKANVLRSLWLVTPSSGSSYSGRSTVFNSVTSLAPNPLRPVNSTYKNTRWTPSWFWKGLRIEKRSFKSRMEAGGGGLPDGQQQSRCPLSPTAPAITHGHGGESSKPRVALRDSVMELGFWGMLSLLLFVTNVVSPR
ncbi:hypothetical protein EYF80_031038 [Liparis tanakae]|uniref:Uncharacterized protein n=1 Tax=Liparis tanakae TaxID=230148 RepID=A0A4Z2H0V9_9TELE|nr:hypothetical protein EYF80_031038 [Liparis tanakae]